MTFSTLPRIASQLEPSFNTLLADRLQQPVLPIPRGVPVSLPDHVSVLVAAPIDRVAPAPAGWPFGLEWIQLVSSGIDMHPNWVLHGRPTSTARGVAAETIAEYVLAAIFDDVKSFGSLRVSSPEQWKNRTTGALRGSTIGLVGLGAIGEAVAAKLLHLRAEVLAFRRSAQPSGVAGVQLLNSLHEVLGRADHLVLAAPATPETSRLIDAAAFAAAKPGLHLINVARGELVDDAALLHALETGQVRRATLDVTAPEPLPLGHPFYSHSRIWLTPHSAALGHAPRLALIEKISANHERWRQGLPLLDAVQSASLVPA